MAGPVWTPSTSTLEDLETGSLINLHEQTLRRLHEATSLSTSAKRKLETQRATIERILDGRPNVRQGNPAPPEGPPEASLDQAEGLGDRCTSGTPHRSKPPGSKRREAQDRDRQTGDLGVDVYDGVTIPPCADGEVRHLCCEGCGWVKILPITCKRRTCPTCQHTRFKEMMAKYTELAEATTYPKLLTLTLKRGHDPTAMVDRLLSGFKKLRRREVFEHQVGGAYFLEGKPPTKDQDGWNVHLHVLVDGPPMPQAVLSRAWEEITGDSPIVDIRKVNPMGGLGYALGYALKGSKIKATWDGQPEELKEKWEAAVKRRNLVHTFGNWHGQAADDEPLTCPECGASTWYILEYLGEASGMVAEAQGLSLWTFPGTDPPNPQRQLSTYHEVTA